MEISTLLGPPNGNWKWNKEVLPMTTSGSYERAGGGVIVWPDRKTLPPITMNLSDPLLDRIS